MMSGSHSDATTTLIADPAGLPAKDSSFPVVAKGYHREVVDEWVRWALREMERLGRLAGGAVTQVARTPEGQQLLSDLLKMAVDELEGQKAAAAAEAGQMLAGAKEQAERLLADARAQAEQTIGSATLQASSLLDSAQADAKGTTDQAEAKAAAVREAAGARMAALAKLHEDGIARLAKVNEVTTDILAAEKERGPLSAEVTRALAPAQQPARAR